MKLTLVVTRGVVMWRLQVFLKRGQGDLIGYIFILTASNKTSTSHFDWDLAKCTFSSDNTKYQCHVSKEL